MLFSYARWFVIDIVRSVIYTLWLFDYFAQLSKKTLALGFTTFTLFVCTSMLYVNIYSFVKAHPELLDSYVTYSEMTSLPLVLGAADVYTGPEKIADVADPIFSAKSVLAVDKSTNIVLYDYNSGEKLALASTTKLMTAMVSLDIYDEGEFVTMPNICTTVASTKAWLPAGSVFKFEDLLNALLISSSGDAACALATAKVGYDEFVERMNFKAQDFGMTDTNFTNPVGLDGLDNSHFSTAEDLYKLAFASMDISQIRDIVAKPDYRINSLDGSFTNRLFTTNALLSSVPGTIGIKTGTTQSAGEVFVYEYSVEEKDIVIIVMGSKDRFADTKNILDWVLTSYSWDQ